MARLFTEMRQMSTDELIREYDTVAKHTTGEGLLFIRDEIFQRELAEQGNRMEQLTNQMAWLTKMICWLTVVIAFLTAISTYAVIAA